MLDVKFIRENKELVEKSAREKGYKVDINKLLAVDDERKAELVQVEELRKKRNEILGSALRYGVGIRQLARLTAMNYGIIQRINEKVGRRVP